MKLSEAKKYISRIFKYKTLSERQYDNVRYNIEKFREVDPFYYNLTMGKFLVTYGDSTEAIPYLQQAAQLDSTRSNVYYNLYKCFVRNGNFKEAYLNLHRCDEFENGKKNFSLPLSLLRAIIDVGSGLDKYLETDYSLAATNVEGYNVIEDAELAEWHGNLITAFNDRDYDKCLEFLTMMDEKIQRINYPMEVETLTLLVNSLRKSLARKYMNLLSAEQVGEIDDTRYADIISFIHSLGFMSTEAVLRRIDGLLEDNLPRAKALLSTLVGEPKFARYADMIEYLNGIVRERESFLALDDETKTQFLEFERKLKNKYRKKQYDKCVEGYVDAKEVTGLPICDYYVGKALYRQGELEQAREMFLSYLTQGGEKTEASLMFLSRLEKALGNRTQANKYTDMLFKIRSMFDRDSSYVPHWYIRKFGNPSETKRFGEVDFQKQRQSKVVELTSDEFSQQPSLTIEDFYDVGLDGKLTIIRGLLQTGNEKVANKLLTEVQSTCTENERAAVKQFERNKKVYRNQNRTDS